MTAETKSITTSDEILVHILTPLREMIRQADGFLVTVDTPPEPGRYRNWIHYRVNRARRELSKAEEFARISWIDAKLSEHGTGEQR